MDLASIGTVIGLAVGGLFLLLLIFGSIFTVQHQTAAVIQRFGKFNRIATAGLQFKVPLIDQVVSRQSLQIQALDVKVETKTQDNVFVHVVVSVQYYVLPEKVYEAHYKLSDPHNQIRSYVFDVVRAKVPGLPLDDVFEKKDEIANEVKRELLEVMSAFGYAIERALVTDIEPDAKVKAAMNEINSAQRLRLAANEKGEADKVLVVKKAEAEAASKALQGKGIADQRRAIVEGLRESVAHFQEGVPGATPQDVMNLVLMNQYFDTLRDLAHGGKLNTIMIPHSPGALADLSAQMRNAVIQGEQVTQASAAADKPVSETPAE